MPTTPEERAARKAEKRAVNRKAWLDDPRNAAFPWRRAQMEMRAALDAPAAEVQTEEPAEPLGSDSLGRMRAIMLDATATLGRRLDAAETLSMYELGIAGAVGVAPDEIAASSHKFLRAVVDAEQTPDAARYRALKALIIIENRRAAARSSSDSHRQHREMLRRIINAARSAELRRAGTWQDVVDRGEEWALTTADTFDEPETLEHEALLGVKAKTRPDDWRQLLSHNI